MPEILPVLERILKSGHYILGDEGLQFESEIGRFLGVEHAVGVNSGTDALVIALRSLGIGPGDEVITTPFSFFATAEAISLVGAMPVFADIQSDSLNIDPYGIRISKRTKAILPVHLFGHSADLTSIMELANGASIPVIEDVAQAFGGTFLGRRIGSFGTLGCLSFFPTKNLGACGDAGMLVTDNFDLAQQARKLRVHGAKDRYHHEMLGYNSRLDELQAAILRIKLSHVNPWNAQRIEAARYYGEQLSGVSRIQTPSASPGVGHVYNQYTIRIKGDRDGVHRHLCSSGIPSMVYYPIPLHQLPMYLEQRAQCPEAELASREVLSLPIWPEISKAQQDRVVAALKSAMDHIQPGVPHLNRSRSPSAEQRPGSH